MELVKWDAYNYVDDYVDVTEWFASFFYSNERVTLMADIEEKILRGKRVTFDCTCNDESVRVSVHSGESFYNQMIGNLESNFIIRQLDDDNYRIDLMNKSGIEIVTFFKRIYEEDIN
jgi:hypothetical protein